MNYIYSTILFEKKICLFCLVKWYIRLEYTIIISVFIVLRQIFRDIPFRVKWNGIILRFESAADIIYTLANEDRFDEKSVQIYHFGLLVKQNYIKIGLFLDNIPFRNGIFRKSTKSQNHSIYLIYRITRLLEWSKWALFISLSMSFKFNIFDQTCNQVTGFDKSNTVCISFGNVCWD